jgi:hypothetical protein
MNRWGCVAVLCAAVVLGLGALALAQQPDAFWAEGQYAKHESRDLQVTDWEVTDVVVGSRFTLQSLLACGWRKPGWYETTEYERYITYQVTTVLVNEGQERTVKVETITRRETRSVSKFCGCSRPEFSWARLRDTKLGVDGI